MINYYTISPEPALANYVRSFWVLEGVVNTKAPYIHRTMADGGAELFFHYRGIFDELHTDGRQERSVASGISGPSKKYSRFSIHENFGMFGVYLYPFALQKLFNIPASALSNEMPDLKTLFGQEGANLEERMMLAAGNLQRTEILNNFFRKQLLKNYCTDAPLLHAIHHVVQQKGNINVDELAARCFLSKRQFERRFRTCSGFTPKLYSRIIRFQAAAGLYGNKFKSLTEIAYNCGYYDQSHFIHDFKEFSGYHPRKYFSGNAEGVEWRDC